MKKYKIILAFIAVIGIFITACEPQLDDRPDVGAAPDTTLMDFDIVPGADAFSYTLINNSPQVNGNVIWDFGNGLKGNGDEVQTKYSVEGTFTITMTIMNQGGRASISKNHNQLETDFALFENETVIALTGGTSAVNGKTWVVDSTEVGHFGIGPADGTWPQWWAAAPLQKTNSGGYDDSINFKIENFAITYMNNNDSYVKDYQIGNENYSNPVPLYGETDARVTYPGPISGTWSIVDGESEKFIVVSSAKPIFFGFDYGGERSYRIDEISTYLLKLSVIGGDGNRWYYQLIPKGYVKPKLEYDLSITATANPNEYSIGITNVVLPEGWSISNIAYSFGDGTSSQTTDAGATFTQTYMRKGTYLVEVTVTANDETFTNSESVVVASNHPSYIPYLLDAMVMYNDFGETTIMAVEGQDCGVTTVANPDNSLWPNRSNNCAMYSKTNQQWANAFMLLPTGYRFDLTQQSTFKILVYGTAGHTVLLKLENTDRGGNAWQTGTADVIYTIQESNKWEIAEFNFAGVGAGWDWTGDIYTSDVTTDPNFNQDFYNVVRIMLNPGDDSQAFSFYFDDLAGPHVEGLK